MTEYLLFSALTYPNIDPIIVQFGPIAIRWYSLAYLGGLIFAGVYMSRLIRVKAPPCNQEQISDYIFWAMMGIIFGGRLGYVLFYNFSYYLSNPGRYYCRLGRRHVISRRFHRRLRQYNLFLP